MRNAMKRAVRMLTMEVHDYEYYELHAKDVKLEDITSSQNNADLLAKIRDNDPKLKIFAIVMFEEDDCDFIVREGDDLGWVGYFVGRSEKIESLYIDNYNDSGEKINLNEFLRGARRNRSIQDLHINADLGESFMRLMPFVRNNDSLRYLNFHDFHIGLQCAGNIALLLGQRSSWKGLNFHGTTLDDEAFVEIVTPLRSQPQIEQLWLSSDNIVRDGYVALGNALKGCLNLRKLHLAVNGSDIDDEGMHAVAEGLKHCHNLTSLNLDGNLIATEEGSMSLSTLFQSDNCRLEYLDMSRMNLDDDEMAVLAPGLASLPSLKRFYLRDNFIGDEGLKHLVRGLVNCKLEQLDLYGNTLMDSVSGMGSLGTLVRRTTNMRSLDLSCCCLTDEGLQSFVEGMANCCSLKELNLSHNRSITANGLSSFSSLFRAEHCSLCTLFLHGINIGDDGAVALANGLRGNKSLTTLYFNVSNITAKGWAAFSTLLCDTSSVNNTYLSNHTLAHVGGYVMHYTPEDIVQYLKLNESQYHGAAAICKILHSHPDIDVTPLLESNLKCLPSVVAWFEKAKPYLSKVNESTEVLKNRQLSAIYKFIRGVPLLAANRYRSQKVTDVQLKSKSKKRKFGDQTLCVLS